MLSASRFAPVRLARPMARRPLAFALLAAAACAVAGAGFARFGVDAGSGLLVGRNSQAGQAYDSFSRDFGSDPIVVVLSADTPARIYTEANVTRLAIIEQDLARDSRVASVLGPGTIAVSSLKGIHDQVAVIDTEYGQYAGDAAEADIIRSNHWDVSKLTTDQSNQLSQVQQAASTAAVQALAVQVIRATSAAEQARAQFDARKDPTAKVIDGRERTAQDAVDKIELPPLFAQFINTLDGARPDAGDAAARRLFDNFSAAYGVCDQNIARVLQAGSSCQTFIERFLLDLPNCPTAQQLQQSGAFCQPKVQWGAALPRAQRGQPAREVITVRLKPQAVGDGNAVRAVRDQINKDLANPSPKGAVRPFAPIQCRDRATRPTSQEPFTCVVAGAPLLAQGVVTVTTHLLEALFPVALLVMLLLLVGTFRVRGRVWPLAAAGLSALLTLGLTLAFGVSVTPAVLAGVPVLVGLGVDYAVQLVARFAEERRRGLGVEAGLREVLEHTGPATLAAALATLAGLLSLGIVAGIDWGPLVAVPLVAEFALVLVGGIVFSWLAALLIALPAAAWRERRAERLGGRPVITPAPAADPQPARRTAALAARWRVVVLPAALLGLAGWVALPRVPVQTDVEKLLAPSLQELKAVQTVRDQTGYTNELDLYLRGDVVATSSSQLVPAQVDWQARVSNQILCDHPESVVQAISIADVLTANASSPSPASARRCSATSPGSQTPGGTPSPSPSPGAPATPAASPSPSASPGARIDGGVVRAARLQPAVAQATPAPSGAPVSPASPSAAATPAPSAAATPAPATAAPNATLPPQIPQGPFVCTLRTFASLTRVLVNGFSLSTEACPPVDVLTHAEIRGDPTPVQPTAARIVLGVDTASLADQARLVDSLRSATSGPPAGVNSVEPTGLAALAVQAYNTLTGRALMLNLVPLLVVAAVLFALHREPRRALLPVLPTALAAGWAPLVVLLLGRIPRAGDTLGAFNPLTVVLGALVIALGTEFGVVLLGRFYEERARGLGPDEAAGAALAGVGRAVGVSAATLAAGFAVLALSGLVPAGLPLVADFGLEVVIDLGLAVLAVFVVMLPLAVAIERVAPAPLPAVAAPVPSRFRRLESAPAGAGSRRRIERRPATVDKPASWAPPAGDEAAPLAEPDLEPSVEPAARPELVPWAPPGEDEPAPLAEPAVRGRSEPEPEEQPQPQPEPAGRTPAAATPPVQTGPRRFPGVSGRRPTAVSTEAVAPPPAAEPGSTTSHRLPGLSGRRRPFAPPPPSPASLPPQEAGAGRRLPGGVVPRRRPPEAAVAPPAGVTPPSVAPPLPPVAPTPPGPPAGPPAGAPTASTPEPAASIAPPAGPDEGRPRAGRRRRPPPHVRRRERPPDRDRPTDEVR